MLAEALSQPRRRGEWQPTGVHSLISRRNFNAEGLDAFDMPTTKPDGQAWNRCDRKDRQLARRLIEEKNPDLLLGAPPCTTFSIWSYAMVVSEDEQGEGQIAHLRRTHPPELHVFLLQKANRGGQRLSPQTSPTALS